MLSEDFSLYYQETLSLVRSLVIKVNFQNTLLNNFLRAANYPVPEDPATWKYNLNLTGEYHSLDLPMTVMSSDTQTEIDFTKATLANHPRTRLDHLPGTPGYAELTRQFPKQRILINGILNPVNMGDVIAAKDMQILTWNPSYVGRNETGLIGRIQEWIDNFYSRWWNSSYAVSDSYYPATFLALLYQHMVPAVMNIRLETARTHEVADFHLWTYLGAHYGLSEYRGVLNNKQALWLYRNIVDIRRQAGKAEKLEEMLEHLSRPRGIAMKQVEFVQFDDTLLSTLRRRPSFSVSPLGATGLSYASGDTLTTEEVFQLTASKATDNLEELTSDVTSAEFIGQVNESNLLPTKIIRADADGGLATQTRVDLPLKIQYWVYLSTMDWFGGLYLIPLPGKKDVYLSARDAFILYVYAINYSSGIDSEIIPPIRVHSVIPQTYPSRNDLRPLADERITNEDIDAILADLVVLRPVGSVAEFTTLTQEINNQHIRHELLATHKRHPDARSMMWDLAAGCQTDLELALAPTGSRFDDWFIDQGIERDGISALDWFEVAQSILAVVIDYTDDGTGLYADQRAMIEIIDRLTSYNVMFVEGKSSQQGHTLHMAQPLLYGGEIEQEFEDLIDIGVSITDDSATAIEHTLEGDLQRGAWDLSLTVPPSEFDITIGNQLEVELGTEGMILMTTGSPYIEVYEIIHLKDEDN